MLVDIPKDILQAKTTFTWPKQLDLPGYRPNLRPHAKQVREAAKLIRASERPVLYVGGGVLKAHAAEELLALAELTGIPVVTTLMARGAFPDSHPQHLGHARHARLGRGRDRAAEVRPAHHPRRPLRRPGDRQPADVRARAPR